MLRLWLGSGIRSVSTLELEFDSFGSLLGLGIELNICLGLGLFWC